MLRKSLLTLVLLCSAVTVASAASTSLFDPARLSVGARLYRTFDEGGAGQYSSEWRVGIPLAWVITSPNDPSVKFPISIVAAVESGIPAKQPRLSIGVVLLLKRAQ